MNSSNRVPATVNTLDILELLANPAFESATLTEIANELSMNKSTCLRILKTLEEREYVKCDPVTKAYSLGLQFFHLAEKSKSLTQLIDDALSVFNGLEHPKATFVLVKRSGFNELRYIAKKEPTSNIRLSINVDSTFPITFGSLGKCFVAFLPDKEQCKLMDEIIKNGKLPEYTERSITQVDQFKAHLQQIREEGIARSKDEYVQGLTTLAVPVFDSGQQIFLGLGAYMFTSFTDTVNMEELEELMKKFANMITNKLQNRKFFI